MQIQSHLVMSEWFVGKEVTTSAINDRKVIEEDQIEVRYQSDGVLDENRHPLNQIFLQVANGWMLVKAGSGGTEKT